MEWRMGDEQLLNRNRPAAVTNQLTDSQKNKKIHIFSPYHPQAGCDIQSGRNPGIPGLKHHLQNKIFWSVPAW